MNKTRSQTQLLKKRSTLRLVHLTSKFRAFVNYVNKPQQKLSPGLIEVIRLPTFKVAGLSVPNEPSTLQKARLWEAVKERISEIRFPDEKGIHFGIFQQKPDMHETAYLAGVPVQQTDQLPTDMALWETPARTYAVLETDASNVQQAFELLYHHWLPYSDYKRADGDDLELYNERFSVQHPTLWVYVPVQKK